MTFIKGHIKTKPVQKDRPKLTKTGRAYNTQKTKNAQRQQAFLFSVLMKKYGHENNVSFPVSPKTPLAVTVRFFHKGGVKNEPKMTVPDIDNLLKLTLDAMTNAGIWRDDNQITKLQSEDLWAGADGEDRIEIEVSEHIYQREEPQQSQLFEGV